MAKGVLLSRCAAARCSSACAVVMTLTSAFEQLRRNVELTGPQESGVLPVAVVRLGIHAGSLPVLDGLPGNIADAHASRVTGCVTG
jgi:hypothetical protein